MLTTRKQTKQTKAKGSGSPKFRATVAEPQNEDPPEDIRVFGLIEGDIALLTDIFTELANSGERYHSDLRLAHAAAVRLNRRIGRLIESAEDER